MFMMDTFWKSENTPKETSTVYKSQGELDIYCPE